MSLLPANRLIAVLILLIAIDTICGGKACAVDYYVSPTGQDNDAGTSVQHPWKTCGQVNRSMFKPGDRILFQRGGEWRESLIAGSSGAIGRPVTFADYGQGAKPRFLGSDPLDNSKFVSLGGDRYGYPIATHPDSVLADHAFIPCKWDGGQLIITSQTDPHRDAKVYTACNRGNVLFSNHQSHLVFKNLIVDETAGQLNDGAVQGYGVRIEGSADVLLDSCEAFHCGRHHFAAINSTDFVGRHLVAAYALPDMPGGNTAYVSYADAGSAFPKCSSDWDDIRALHMDDGKGGRYPMFVSHGDHQGLIRLSHSTADAKLSFMSSPAIVDSVTLTENASIENWGNGVLLNGITLLDSSAIDQWGSDGTIQNCLAHLSPQGNGPTGYAAAVVIRNKSKRNTVRFNTLITNRFSALELVGESSATRWIGNIMQADGPIIVKASGPFVPADVAEANFNCYSPGSRIFDKPISDWQSQKYDQASIIINADFVNPAAGDFALTARFAAEHQVTIPSLDIPAVDHAGHARPASGKVRPGAFR